MSVINKYFESSIRQAFKGTLPPHDFISHPVLGDLPPNIQPRRPWKPAAVLMPIIMHPGKYTVLLTQRTEGLLDHAGQVSFPGGSREPGEADPVQTALRETEEETGLERGFVETVGFLDGYLTITGYAVTPVIGLVKPGFQLRPDPLEVADIFEVPLEFLRNPVNRQLRARHLGNREVGYYLYEYNNHLIWGATAAMLVNFFDKLQHMEAA